MPCFLAVHDRATDFKSTLFHNGQIRTLVWPPTSKSGYPIFPSRLFCRESGEYNQKFSPAHQHKHEHAKAVIYALAGFSFYSLAYFLLSTDKINFK